MWAQRQVKGIASLFSQQKVDGLLLKGIRGAHRTTEIDIASNAIEFLQEGSAVGEPIEMEAFGELEELGLSGPSVSVPTRS